MTSTALHRAAFIVVGVATIASLAGCGRFFVDSATNPTTTLLTLPATTTTAVPVVTTTAAPAEYVIERGDTMRKIAAKFNTSVEAILAANPKITDPNKIQAGQRIVIPPPTPVATVPPTPSSTG